MAKIRAYIATDKVQRRLAVLGMKPKRDETNGKLYVEFDFYDRYTAGLLQMNGWISRWSQLVVPTTSECQLDKYRAPDTFRLPETPESDAQAFSGTFEVMIQGKSYDAFMRLASLIHILAKPGQNESVVDVTTMVEGVIDVHYLSRKPASAEAEQPESALAVA